MINSEREQLYLENLEGQQSSEPLKNESLTQSGSEFKDDERECSMCGGSGSCSGCPRGRKLKIEKDNKPYQRKK